MNWKNPPSDPDKLWINPSLEMQILLACNWSCVSCDQGSQFSKFDFVKKGTMTFGQIDHFVREMQEKNAYLGRIRVAGGEPTLHKDFKAIIERLYFGLVLPGHLGQVEVITNGSRVGIAQSVSAIARIRYSGEASKQKTHVANLIHTPKSLGYRGTICNAPWFCGISLNYWGYFPCSSGSGIARFQDWMKWQRLELPTKGAPERTVQETWPELQDLCDHCYHGLRPEHKIKSGTQDPENNKPGEHIAADISAWDSGKKADWKVYGEI